MSRLAIDPSLCRRDGICVAECPVRLIEQEAGTLRQQVFRIRKPARITARHRQVAPLHADRHGRRQVISRREAPVGSAREHRMVARVIVDIGDQRVEAHSAEQLGRALPGLCTDAPQLFRQQDVRPFVA